ncbi:uncharacterized protein N7511_009793 [Penicillium nucicola]|uniref:uncharacterized protein n=1 Tax=Penicillium nucicola TaxID=1850975 RepID=UPI0025450367|nr:uncharacterized protein N7511_009793 [Penicillium nucicola]KAJ5748097.1 hypothetical protein N7511_009793 [Penicillium nucicola]
MNTPLAAPPQKPCHQAPKLQNPSAGNKNQPSDSPASTATQDNFKESEDGPHPNPLSSDSSTGSPSTHLSRESSEPIEVVRVSATEGPRTTWEGYWI